MKIPIARRVFYRNAPDSPEGCIQVTVEIFQPCLDSKVEPPVWKCLLVIEGLGRRIRQSFFGEDSIQALYHSLFIAGVMLSTSKFSAEIDKNDERNTFANMVNFGFPELNYADVDMKLIADERPDTERNSSSQEQNPLAIAVAFGIAYLPKSCKTIS